MPTSSEYLLTLFCLIYADISARREITSDTPGFILARLVLTRFISASAKNRAAVNRFIACLVALNFFGGMAGAAETPETVLIRQVLSTEKSGVGGTQT